MGGLSMVFRAASHTCAVDIERVVEVMRPLPVRALVGVPWFVRGVSVIRGVPTPVVDVDRLVGGDGAAAGRFVLITDAGRPVALAVRQVMGVRDLTGAARDELPPLLDRVAGALAAVDTELLVFLAGARIVPDTVWAGLDGDGGGG